MTAEVFVLRVAAETPELRRPRFSFLYLQLVKEPVTEKKSGTGELTQPLRTTDRCDQLASLKYRGFKKADLRILQNREPPCINPPAHSVKMQVPERSAGLEPAEAMSRFGYIASRTVNATLKIPGKHQIFQFGDKF